jgi:GT2 family glycosyltransferase
LQALVIGRTRRMTAILARPMETPDPTPGPGLLEPPAGAEEDDRPDGDPVDADLDGRVPSRVGAPPPVPETDASPEPDMIAAAPSVVAVVVTSDPGPWLEDALASLGAQEYPALSVLVLDNGSAEDPTPRIATAMPRAFVRRLPANVGFAAAANDAMTLVEGATFLLFCHDDVVLGPDAVGVMVEEAYRSNAGIVGPKLVDYEHPEMLLEVGMAVDHYGVPFSGIEPGELDQEQHDAVRDVFFVSDAAMLVRADLFHELGGFDPGTFPGSDDLDLCWRARLAGARVLVAPDARVRHRRATVQDERPSRRDNRGDLKAWTQSRVRVLTKSYSPVVLLWVLPVAFALNVLEAVALVVTRRPARARALLAGWFATFGRGSDIRTARASTQRLRRVDDGDVSDLMVRGSARVRTLVTYRLHAGDRLAEVSSRTRAAVSEASTRLRAFHVVAAIGLIVLIAFGSRSLIFDRVPEVGALRDWPGAGPLWSTFFAPWRYAMMGADAPASPVFGVMALLSTALFGDTDLARTLVVAGALPLGAYGAYRLARPLAGSAIPAVAASVAYAVNPIVRNAIGEGQLGPLVCFGLAPFIMRALLRAAGDVDRRTRMHAVATVALLLLVVAAAWPPALLFALVIAGGFALAWPLVGGTHIVGRTAATATVATIAAFVLLLPWTLTLFGADAATFAFLPRAPRDLVDILSFHTGASGSGFGAVGLLVAALLPLVVATGSRLAWAGRAWMVALVSFACAWVPSRLDAGASVPAPEGVLVPAALGLALAVGLGLAAFLEELRTFHFGWRQFAAVAAAVGIALPVLGFAADTLDGKWGLPKDDWPARFSWMGEDHDRGDFRVLWVGDPTILPTDTKIADGVGFGLTRQGPGDARSLWAPPEGDADRVLADAIGLVRDQHTVGLGHLVAPAGVRYIAYLTRAAPDSGAQGRRDPALAASLEAQLDLAVSRIEPGAIVYENQAWVPARAHVPPATKVPLDSADPLAAAQRTTLPDAQPVKGPLAKSEPAGPGTLLWAEAANSGWRATLDGKRAPRSDAYGWTNAFTLDRRGRVDLSFSGGPRRLLAFVELLLWAGVGVVWWRTRRRVDETAVDTL